MIRIGDGDLPADARADLRRYQDEIDAAPTYEARVDTAKSLFGRRNRRDNATFRSVRATLDRMCSGPRRCMYCEDSVADEIEHYRPKDLYPEVVFAWENYLYACGRCNGPKNNRFEVFSAATGHVVDVTRPRTAPVVEPDPGDPLLIDPRRDDPLEFLRLDLLGTFHFQEVHPRPTREYTRAHYTIDVLHLNDREYLRVAREIAYEECRSILQSYILERNAKASPPALDRKIRAIRRKAHVTVWAEMKRQRDKISELGELFEAVPEALSW